MAGITISDLSKTFTLTSGRPLHVLDNLTLDARDGEFVCLLGPSGCGKSTSLNILVGLVKPDSGVIRVDGQASYKAATYGYVFQRPRLLNWKSVKDNVYFALECYGVPRSEWEPRLARYLALVGLEPFKNEFPGMLSGGMQQRVGICRALAVEPDILLMDEPFSGLDELTARRMRAELLAIWSKERKTVLFVTHNALEAVYLADRVYLLSNRPTRVERVVEVSLPRPRDSEDPRLLSLYREVVSTLVGA